ncbi:MAG: DUF3253 domain-containing protein [Rhodobacteraceae bacterium]|nr:MAG: DUF3253 domain-containing protein [Paracoccaceae bacterium]
MPRSAKIEAALRSLALARGPNKSFFPCKVARHLSSDWRPLMPDVRRVAARLQADGLLQATKAGQPVELARARGPIRLSLPTGQDDPPC